MHMLSLARISFRFGTKDVKPMINGTLHRKAGHYPHHGGIYRNNTPPNSYGPVVRVVKGLQVVFWWHVFYSFWYDPDLVFGHPTYQPPDPNLWTDEDLGIPPDDYDEVV